jgi:carotenoid cleavage dioxygenase-like enzyme
MWRLNTRTGAVVERQLDDVFVEFPRVNDDFICSGARYSYMSAIKSDEPTLKTNGLIKYDLRTDRKQSLQLPPHQLCYEASFAPRDGGDGEDDGYLVNFVTNELDSTSEFWVTRARDIEGGPVARVSLPQRVPPKFHGRWLPASLLR